MKMYFVMFVIMIILAAVLGVVAIYQFTMGNILEGFGSLCLCGLDITEAIESYFYWQETR